ncbi:MAG: hypothetical protein AAGC44_01260 [Planctomycetota bacterium]
MLIGSLSFAGCVQRGGGLNAKSPSRQDAKAEPIFVDLSGIHVSDNELDLLVADAGSDDFRLASYLGQGLRDFMRGKGYWERQYNHDFDTYPLYFNLGEIERGVKSDTPVKRSQPLDQPWRLGDLASWRLTKNKETG